MAEDENVALNGPFVFCFCTTLLWTITEIYLFRKQDWKNKNRANKAKQGHPTRVLVFTTVFHESVGIGRMGNAFAVPWLMDTNATRIHLSKALETRYQRTWYCMSR